MDQRRRSKDMLRKEQQRIIEEKRKLDLEIARDNLSEGNLEELPWDGNESSKVEKLKNLEAELEEVQRKLEEANLA